MSHPRPHILPPSASALMRAVDRAAPQWDTMPAALRGTLYGHPAALAPWLAGEWALAPFARYFGSTGELIERGIPWLVRRGTPASVRMALGWVGHGQAQPEEDGPYLHIQLTRIPTAAEVQSIAHVVRASLPVHVRLWRVHWGHDVRALRLDKGPPLDAGLLDNDSGVWMPAPGGPDVLASFGMRHRAAAPQPVATRAGSVARVLRTHARVGRITYDDRLILDAWRLDSRILVDAFGGIGELYSHTVTAHPRRAPISSASRPHHTRVQSCAWAPRTIARAHHTATPRTAPSPVPTPRTWDASTWRAGRWRALLIQRKHTQESK